MKEVGGNMSKKILVIDDDQKVTTMIRRGLTFEGYEVNVANGGREGLMLILEQPPDLVILDVMMPGIDGLEVCRRLRKDGNIPILMVTGRDTVADRVEGLETGADDYLVKPFAFEELVARVKALLRRSDHHTTGDFIHYADLTIDFASRTAIRNGRQIGLSTTEFNLLELFIRNPKRVLARDLIMERIWGYNFQGESNVLEVYVGYLRQKLESQSELRLIHTVRGTGYVMRE